MTNSITYESNQDFATRMAVYANPRLCYRYLPRVLANDSQDSFERHLHEAMGYRAEHANEQEF